MCWRMTWLTRHAVLLLVTLCLSSAEDKALKKLFAETAADTVEVFYHRSNITAARGSSVKLSCEARYILSECRLRHAGWNWKSTELTNPRKYLTTVSETELDDSMRSRQVETEILDLTPEDSGGYQCTAECEGEDSAIGHFIYIYVQG